MKTLDRLNIKSLDGLAVMNVNEPSVGDYERIMAENRRLVAACAEYEKIIAELEGALEFMTMPITSKEPTIKTLLETFDEDTKRGREALQKLKEFKGAEMSTYYWMSCEDCKKQTEDTIVIQRLSGECLDNPEVLVRFLMNHQYHNLQLFSEHDEIRSEYPADRRETNDIQK